MKVHKFILQSRMKQSIKKCSSIILWKVIELLKKMWISNLEIVGTIGFTKFCSK